MTKRISAKIFVLFASILLVAHAVIPHIHFKNEVYIITSACSLDENHKKNAPEHRDDCNKNVDFCLLKQIVLIRTDEVNSDSFQPFIIDKNDFDHSPFIILTSHSNIFYPQLFSGPPNIFKVNWNSRLAECNINSRGSPIV